VPKTRLEAFADGIFAIAATLLTLNLAVTEGHPLGHELLIIWPQYAAYAISFVTIETEQTFLVRINEIQVIALGQNGKTGTLVTVCQTIVVEIQQIIVVVQPAPGGGDDGDIKTVR